jgi:hypothetical protein
MAVTYKDIVESGDMACSREELMTVAAAVFRTLFSKTPASVMQQNPQIVIGVPLIFPDYAKKRLLDIVVRSGVCGSAEPYREALRRVRFLPEPIGASLLYALDCKPPRGRSTGRVLVFDSGGGTLDLALLEFGMMGDEYRPVRQLALRSEVLAGKRFDQCIEEFGLSRHRDAVLRWNRDKADPVEVTGWQLAQAAESIKVNLSTREEHEELSLIGAGVRPRITRREFEHWAEGILAQTASLVRSTVADMDDVDTVVMVGGSSLIPCVQRLMRELFPAADVVHENPNQVGRGEGVERALTAVSKGLALYDETVARQGITPFAYGFWDTVTNKVIPAAPKWSSHSDERPIVQLTTQPGRGAATLTLVQEMVEPERVLNVVNVPATGTNGERKYVYARVHTSDGGLYPDIEVLRDRSGVRVGLLKVSELPDRVLRDLVEHDDHVIRWEGSSRVTDQDTSYPEVVMLRVGDVVEFCQRRRDGAPLQRTGTIFKIHKIADGRRYQEVGHWDLTRWRFYIRLGELGETPFVPALLTDIRLARRQSRERRREWS